MSKEGMDREMITLYLQGAFDGINSFSVNLQENKLKIQPEENDPLFIHTWNHVIDSLTEKMEEMVQQALKEIPKELGVNYASAIKNNPSINSMDKELYPTSSPKQ